MKTFKEHNLFKWREVRLGDVARIRRGASPRPIDNPRWFAESGPGWVRISDVTRSNGRLRVTEQYLSQDGIDRSVRVGRGDVIMSICATIGEPVIIEMDACIHDGFVVFDQFENLLDRHFLLHLLRKIAPEFKASGQTGTQANLNTGIVNGKVVAIPSEVFEQSRIAAVLDTVDEAIAKTEAVIAKLKQVRASLLHDLLTRGLEENGQLRDPIAHPEQFQDSPIGRIPRGWFCEPLGKHTVSSAYGPRFPGECYSERGNVALLRTTDMDEAGNLALEQMPLANLILDEFRSHFLEIGDFLISRSGTCGIGSVFPGFRIPVLPGAFLIRFRLVTTLLPEFLRLYVNSEAGAKRVSDLAEGGVQKNIRGSALLTHLIPVPPTAEQQVILSYVRSVDIKAAVEQASLGKLRELKSALMADLLTGRVRVPASL